MTVNKDMLSGKVLIAGYGSLLSQDSRQRFSGIHAPTVGVKVHNWSRGWVTRAFHENQTYVGAIPKRGAWLNAQLVPTKIDPALEKREQDYRFSRVDINDIDIDDSHLFLNDVTNVREIIRNTPIYICETLESHLATETYKVSFSYIATCLIGCYEKQGNKGIDDFMRSTFGLSESVLDMDVEKPKYPRAASIPSDMTKHFIEAISQHFRKTK